MEKYHCCASCVHFEVVKHAPGTTYRCKRLGYDTKPDYRFNCWQPNEQAARRMQKESGNGNG